MARVQLQQMVVTEILEPHCRLQVHRKLTDPAVAVAVTTEQVESQEQALETVEETVSAVAQVHRIPVQAVVVVELGMDLAVAEDLA